MESEIQGGEGLRKSVQERRWLRVRQVTQGDRATLYRDRADCADQVPYGGCISALRESLQLFGVNEI